MTDQREKILAGLERIEPQLKRLYEKKAQKAARLIAELADGQPRTVQFVYALHEARKFERALEFIENQRMLRDFEKKQMEQAS